MQVANAVRPGRLVTPGPLWSWHFIVARALSISNDETQQLIWVTASDPGTYCICNFT
jgi:hypothetical protein